jgi:hypothetical protein
LRPRKSRKPKGERTIGQRAVEPERYSGIPGVKARRRRIGCRRK